MAYAGLIREELKQAKFNPELATCVIYDTTVCGINGKMCHF